MTAYEAAVALATIPLHCAGFRTDGIGDHQTTFLALPLVMGAEVSELAGYFDSCRTKSNISSYDRSGQISGTEAKELLKEAMKFKEVVKSRLGINHPKLVAP